LIYSGYLQLDKIFCRRSSLSPPPMAREMLFIIQHQTVRSFG